MISSVGTGYDFGKITLGQSTPQAQFTIENTGTANLNILNISLSGADTDQFILEYTLPFPSLGYSDTYPFTITYNPLSKGKHSIEVSIESNAPDTNPFTFIINGEATDKDTPNMQVYVADQSYYDGSSYYFGEVAIGESSDPVIFTIKNEGSADLRITTYKKRGGETNDFDISFPGTPVIITAGSQIEFSVIFGPLNTGTRSTRLEITTSDGKYNILLEGVGQ